MNTIKQIFDTRLTQIGGIVFILFVILVAITGFSSFPLAHPLWGIILFALTPVLFIIGGIIFVLAILKI